MVAHRQREIVRESPEVTFDSCPPDGPDELAEACAGFGTTSPRRMRHAGREDLLASSLTMTETAEQYVTPFARETFELREERFWSTRWADIEILAGGSRLRPCDSVGRTEYANTYGGGTRRRAAVGTNTLA
jgi:hypothetical protein